MLNELHPLPPASFFQISVNVKKKVGRLSYLPDISDLLNEEMFARVAITWSLSGLTFSIRSKKTLEKSFYPNYREGDSVEFFLDTRDLKNAQSIHRFCHHFVCLPEEVGSVQVQEVTHFRADEAHELADPSLFSMHTKVGRQNYEVEVHIPKEALYGYDPSNFKLIGFAYRINRYGGDPQHFPISSRFFSLEKHPDLWATLILT